MTCKNNMNNSIGDTINKKYNKNNKKNIFTLGNKHNEMLEKIKIEKTNNKNINNKIYDIDNKISELDKFIHIDIINNVNNIKNLDMREQFLKEKSKLELDSNKCLELELDYYNIVGDLIIEYYDMKDNNININNKHIETKNLLDFLHNTNTVSIENKILDKYYRRIDGTRIYKDTGKNRTKYCIDCNIEKILDIAESSYICQLCGYSETVILDEDKQIKDYSPYKRFNHFKEWLEQFQAKQSPDIPEKVFVDLINELNKNRIYDLSTLTRDYIKVLLKKLKYNIYYEHIIYILNKLNNIPPPKLSKDMEKIFNSMFNQIQDPWELYKPKYRKNFLSYSYVLYKFCEILELNHLLKYFSLHKDYDKVMENDEIWKKICIRLNWDYISSFK